MKRFKKFLSTLLCCAVVVAGFASIPVNAQVTYPLPAEIASSSGSTSIYSLPGTPGHEAAGNKNKSQFLCSLTNGTQVIALGVELDGDGDKWYKIKYGENYQSTGYAYINRVCLKYNFPFDEDFESNLLNFPVSYHSALRELHLIHPNWRFVANDFGLTFKDAVEAEYGVSDVTRTRKWVEFSYKGVEWRDARAYNAEADSWIKLEGRWTYASRAAIEYFMDPRNSLNENMIFVFMQQSYKDDVKMQDNLRSVVKGTFLENGYDKDGDGVADKDAYIEDLIKAGKESNVSPYVLAATIIVEQGVKGETNLISGTYPGFEGYYNFYNFNAAGSTVQDISVNGLTYAKKNGWNSRTAAIAGGAKNYASGYINIGQDTYYYKDFNVIKEDWNHQYASALYDAWTNASYLKKGCLANAEATITFSIPVFKDMPQTVCSYPEKHIHSYDNSCDNKCNGCGYVDVTRGHVYSGTDDAFCDNCGHIRALKEFPDVPVGAWFYEPVNYVVGKGIMKGYGGTDMFGTANNLQREEFILMLARYAGVNLDTYEAQESQFSDVPEGAWFEGAINWGAEKGIITGYGNTGVFGVGDTITREQLVLMLCRYAEKVAGKDVTVGADAATNAANRFVDFGNVSDWATDAVLWAVEKGVITGAGAEKNLVNPQGNAQRCEIAQIMYNIYKNGVL